MRAVLIVNPNATSTTPAGRDLLAHALESHVELTVEHTNHRGHAIEIAAGRQARRHRRDHRPRRRRHGERGGQRTAGRPGRAAPAPDRLPAVGVVPGGSANVFARALGISPDPIEATNQLDRPARRATATASWRRIGLMDCGERWAVFTAGMGVDGDVVAAVEAQRAKGRTVTAGRYIRVAAARDAVQRPQGPPVHPAPAGPRAGAGVYFAFVSNASPWTYAEHQAGVDQSRARRSRPAWAFSPRPA